MSHLIEVLETIKSTGVGLYIHTQALNTTTPGGRAMFQMLGVFAEFEREMIRERVALGMDRVHDEIERNGSTTNRELPRTPSELFTHSHRSRRTSHRLPQKAAHALGH
jgi:DNA invertase Pin-like site-specific DNA recombinase